MAKENTDSTSSLVVEPLLKNRIALVTGASRGIGSATAKLLARHGAAVGVNYHKSQQAAQEVVQAIEEEGGRALAVQASVGDPVQIAAMVREVEEQLGPIDTLVLNAAAVERFVWGPFVDFKWEDFEDMVLGELKCVFHPCKAVVPSMIKQRRGCIIAVSSGISRRPVEGNSAHSAGKAGVDGLIRVLAQELGPYGIRANIVAPGPIETEALAHWPPERREMMARITPLRRMGQADDVAGTILMLASDATRFITGAYIPVNGGNMMP